MEKDKRIEIRVALKDKLDIKILAAEHDTNVSQVLTVGARFLIDNKEIAKALLKKA